MTPHANPLLEGLGSEDVSFNAYVRIKPHVDLGQGAASMQASLIAEELDVAFGQFQIEQARADPAYYNTALADEAVPFMSNDTGMAAQTLRDVMGAAFKLAGIQVTGASTSVPDSFHKLRVARAVARATLKASAAAQSGIAVERLRTAQGQVTFLDTTEISYTELG
ncbi:hypothetical protein [Roseobacter fucihabitans]|uniref:hypothetical protein n=1 Tax=Roseobacter fucihabitans TaxID=1537242 RepID=UPI0030CB802A